MLISGVPDEGGGRAPGEPPGQLFDRMAEHHDFEAGEDSLTATDLVLLYKNIDLGKQLMSNANEMKRSPNRRVETVVHREEPESDSELSECFSGERLERAALARKPPDTRLCAAGAADYDRRFLFRDPYIKEQIRNLKLMSTSCNDSAVLPASLLDYICCRRLEDDYNFYMDDIIRYVKNTIEQLKRISNGDYLTDRARRKWREVENEKEDGRDESKVLTASTSIPLHVERKLTGASSTWDELVHSEVDLRSLSKILEKKIAMEVPRLISGSYELFSGRATDDLVISCARTPAPAAARVDVVLRLRRSETGRVVSNIDSVMILHATLPGAAPRDGDSGCVDASLGCQQALNIIANTTNAELLPLTYVETEEKEEKETPKIVELDDTDVHSAFDSLPSEAEPYPESRDDERSSICEFSNCETEEMASPCEAVARRRAATRIVRGEAAVDLASPERMRLTLQPLARRAPPPADDSYPTDKRSPTRVRIKSPYENKSHILEERKRKRLMEVRERRERKKMAMSENKFCKNQYSKCVVAAQASSSVTKLSITNKSFYNSIFGQNSNAEKRSLSHNTTGRKRQKKGGLIPEIVPEQSEDEPDDTESAGTGRGQKFVNRSYYLDDAVTEMCLQTRRADVKASVSTSAVSNDSANLGSLPQLSSASLANLEPSPNDPPNKLSPKKDRVKDLTTKGSMHLVPNNTPKGSPGQPAVECRRSIDKIYTLMKKLGKIDPKKAHACSAGDGADAGLQSDSGTSLKHRVTSSDPSSFSFGKPADGERPDREPASPRSRDPSVGAVVPRVIISAKSRPEPEPERGHRRAPPSPRSGPFLDNPLKAISQLLHEFDNVQKTRQKTAESKQTKKATPAESKAQVARRRGRPETRARPGSPRARARPEPAADAAREARGEAVRGPPALSSRLHLLAQPKRAYLQALAAEPRYPRAQAPERGARTPPARPRARRADAASVPSAKSVLPPLERAARSRRSPASSPERRASAPAPARAPAPPPASLRPLKKKMVAVESYVKQHYGRGAGAGAAEPARAPLLPSDVELLSSMTSSTLPEESSALGGRLHRIVDSMLRAPRRPRAPASPPPASPPPAPARCSPLPTIVRPAPPDVDNALPPPAPCGSLAEITMLENALGHKLSSGTFSKRFRIKNLTAAPEHSLQRIVVLQSGDASSIILDSELSQHFLSDTSECSLNELDFKALSLSATRLDWGFPRMPCTISTVGYAFPSYERDSFARRAPDKIVDIDAIAARKVFDETDEDSLSEDRGTMDQSCQCYKGISASEQALECAVQAGAGAEERHPAPENIPVDLNVHPETEKADDRRPMDEIDDPSEEIAETVEKTNPSDAVEVKNDVLDYTTSLDMLVGLLNEIQKITSYSSCEERDGARAAPAASRARVSRRLASPASNAGLIKIDGVISDFDNNETQKRGIDASTSGTVSWSSGPVCVFASKEVSAQFPAPPELVSVSTDTPSCARLEAPAAPVLSASSLTEYQTTCSEPSTEIIRHTSQFQIVPSHGRVKSLVVFHDANAAKIKDTEVTVMCRNTIRSARCEKSACDKLVAKTNLGESRPQTKYNLNKCCLNAADLDPMIKIKRDILVTVYSFLVLTVFAALSLPDMLRYS